MMSSSRSCFLKMPALSPRCRTAVSQLPRWPTVILSLSAAAAGWTRAIAAIAAAPASCRICFMSFPPVCSDFLKSLDVVQAAEPADQRIGADRQHEQHDQHGVHARHVKNTVGLDDQKADALVGQLGFGE